VFSGVSLLNDASGEIIAPLLPLSLMAVLGAVLAAVGLIEALLAAAVTCALACVEIVPMAGFRARSSARR
jgi:hypothetical protein